MAKGIEGQKEEGFRYCKKAVKEIMSQFGFPGMRVLLFAFDEDNPMHTYLPHTYIKNCITYTGTHDNNTIKGWFDREITVDDKKRLFRYIWN